MWGHRATRIIRKAFQGRLYQSLAIMFCVLFGLAMIVNTQLEGEAWWFWYARLLHDGSKLYADMHLPLQPLMVLEVDAWIQMFGTKCLVTEIPSLVHVLAFCMALFFILRESDWPDWQKAIVLASAFLISVECGAYRFDDFHILADIFIFYSVVLLLFLAKADASRRQSALSMGLGILTGLTITTRVTDGGALLVAAGICTLVLARKRKLFCAALFIIAAAVTVIVVVRLTGDSFSDYATNSILKAAGAKGGGGRISTAPFRIVHNIFQGLRGRKWLFLWTVSIVAASAVVQRYWKNKFRYMVLLQLGMAGCAYIFSSWLHRVELREGAFLSFVVLSLFLLNYLLAPIVLVRSVMPKIGLSRREWNPLEILILIPLAELASTSASSGATNIFFLSPIALLLILMPVIQPLPRQASWVNATLVTIMALVGLNVVAEKIHHPYGWLKFQAHPMFQNRQWYRHPVYGPMYIDSDLLHFIEPVCREISEGNPHPELLSMPWSYSNYFCDTPPWHGYVQTHFDTSTRTTIDQLIGELNTAPPRWIVYERQGDDLLQHERILNGGLPLPHRYLDNLILHKIATKEWQVVEKSRYLFVSKGIFDERDGWYIIRTQPEGNQPRTASP